MELRSFDSLYDLLKTSLSVADVTGGCFANGIISSNERDAVQAADTPDYKAAALLNAVRRTMTINPKPTFETFLNVNQLRDKVRFQEPTLVEILPVPSQGTIKKKKSLVNPAANAAVFVTIVN